MPTIIFPLIVARETENEKPEFVRFLGTAFFIGNEGFFLTAKHVLSGNTLSNLKEGEYVCARILYEKPETTGMLVLSVDEVEKYDNSTDLSIGRISKAQPNKYFAFNENSIAGGWADVCSFGYPEILQVDMENFVIHPNFLKGYVQRPVDHFDDLSIGMPTPPGYLLSYSIPSGMSGSPVIRDKNVIVGICLATVESKIEKYKNESYESNGEKFVKTTNKISELGLSLNLFFYKDWKIGIAGNRRLEELF